MTIKEKRLQILSLAMDINEKYGAVCFVSYSPHTDGMYVEMFGKPWFLGANHDIEYIIYRDEDNYIHDYIIKTHDEMIDILQDILENGLKK